MGYLRRGHPPASGYVNLFVMLLLTPVSFLSATLGLLTDSGKSAISNPKLYFVCAGISSLFFIALCTVFILKVVLGRTV